MKPESTNEAAPSAAENEQHEQPPSANGVVPGQPEEDLLDDEDYNYKPMPPRRVVTYKVRIKVIGRGKPLPYPLDEDEDDDE
jgi:hypothetical protein